MIRRPSLVLVVLAFLWTLIACDGDGLPAASSFLTATEAEAIAGHALEFKGDRRDVSGPSCNYFVREGDVAYSVSLSLQQIADESLLEHDHSHRVGQAKYRDVVDVPGVGDVAFFAADDRPSLSHGWSHILYVRYGEVAFQLYSSSPQRSDGLPAPLRAQAELVVHRLKERRFETH